jgi:hypothetical protein
MTRRTIFVSIIAVTIAGCSHNLTLYPRGGGDLATGTVNRGDRSMQVKLPDGIYTGNYVQGASTGVGLATRYGTAPSTLVMSSRTNQYAALLTNGSRALRCEFMAMGTRGNGVCVDSSDKVYDLKIGD